MTDDDRIKKGKDRSPLFFPSAPSPAEHQAFTSNHSISKYITLKFLSTQTIFTDYTVKRIRNPLKGG